MYDPLSGKIRLIHGYHIFRIIILYIGVGSELPVDHFLIIQIIGHLIIFFLPVFQGHKIHFPPRDLADIYLISSGGQFVVNCIFQKRSHLQFEAAAMDPSKPGSVR